MHIATLLFQVDELEKMEKNVAQLEKSKRNLQDTIAKLREGKDACGHEAELRDLQRQLDRHSSLIQVSTTTCIHVYIYSCLLLTPHLIIEYCARL